MLRIAHISDLHIKHPDIGKEPPTALQRLVELAGKGAGFAVEADGHSEAKLEALENVFKLLRPDVIAVTGDITDYGDRKSFELAADYLKKLKASAGAELVLCVPGNHDTFFERAADLGQSSWARRLILRAAARLNHHVGILAAGEQANFSRGVIDDLERAEKEVLLANFESWRAAQGFERVDPSCPFYVDAGWGEVAFFLFNSTNDPGPMANEGRIGPQQFNRLNVCLQDPDKKDRFDKAVRVALLHHHPLSAPQSRDTAIKRSYDWMQDGPRFLQHVNKNRFHFVLHGHQHEPFHCSINYDPVVRGLYIVAAGSASQGPNPDKGSFNVLDLRNPFQARLTRYDYRDSGFPSEPAVDVLLPVRPIEEVRVTSANAAETVEDWAVRRLVNVAYDLDAAHAYEELDFKVDVTEEELYAGEYRRRGRVVSNEPSEGPVFVISGSPARRASELRLRATDNARNEEIEPSVLFNEPNRKVVRVRPRKLLAPGEEFDVTLRFQWQATRDEPNHLDALNLMYFHPDKRKKHVARTLRYTVTLPWEPAQTSVRILGTQDRAAVCKCYETPALVPAEAGGKPKYRFSFEIEDPRPVTYFITFAPPKTPKDGE